MRLFYLRLAAALLLLVTLQVSAVAQARNNDGFHRVNGQMHVLRNGQLRPMTRDSRLPTGVLVTKDGFLVAANGTRTELREGQGCDLRGRVVPVTSAAGGLALGAPAPARRGAAEPVRSVLDELLGGQREDDEDRYEDHDEYDKKESERAREQRKKDEEWLREEGQRRDEHARGRNKKWKEKRKKGKKWDD
jgi:hypothetical protein